MLIHNPDPIFLLDENGRVLDVNSAAADLFGYASSEWGDLSFRDIIAPESWTDTVALFADTLHGYSRLYKVSSYDKGGKLLHLHVKNLSLSEKDEQTKRILVVAKDVTELVNAKDELRKTAEKLMFFYESSAEAMDIIDLDGNVVQVNKAFEEMYGWKAEEIIGTPMPTIPAKQMEQVERDRRRVLNNESIRGLEVECLKKDGTFIPVSITLSPLHDEYGNIIAFSGISRDISEKKRFEEALIR